MREAWRDAQTDACLDTTVEARIGWDEAMLDRARWCLDERSMQFEAVIDQLSASESQVVAKAVPAAASLPRVDGCRDVNFLARLPSPPMERREAIRQVRVELARVRALAATGSYAEGERAASEALAHAVEVDWPPLVAGARMQLGALLDSDGDFDQAERVQEQAYFEASLAGAHEVAADEPVGRVSTGGSRMARHTEGLRWSRLAEVSRSAIVDPAGLWEAKRTCARDSRAHAR